jgi:hypothetical protein
MEGKSATMLMVFATMKDENELIIDARAEVEYNGNELQTGGLDTFQRQLIFLGIKT